jgi:hypothetical protein
MIRYSIITEKNPREIVMLRGSGCVWKKCRFCDYHLDKSSNEAANFALNAAELSKVTGQYHTLEVINSGSFCDLDAKTFEMIEVICRKKQIDTLHFECHWMHRHLIAPLKERFAAIGVTVKIKLGVETFDALFRESYLVKGITTDSPEEIARYADEVCLLQGIPGQTKESMIADIETGLAFFERVCVNIMVENKTRIKPDPHVISIFAHEVAPRYENDPRVDILMENTDFGVGGI